jgi:carboxymethylenebutenolidase
MEGWMGSTIELTASDGHALSAYVAGPGNAAKGLVVVQEIFGVNHHIRNVTDRFAAQGFAACAPALFDRIKRGIELGYTQDDIAKGREYRMKLVDPQVMADVQAAAKHLRGKRLGIVGYCFGGTVAWWGATRSQSFAAACCWYGGGIAGTKDERPHCPVQMHFGETDQSIPISDVEAIRAAQPNAETYIYLGAGHGFGCDERASYNQQAYESAQQRTLDFFAMHLE